MKLIYGHGINDMYRGWLSENKYNNLVYRKWYCMIQRAYSKKFHERQQTYIGCSVCERWLFLSNFVEDFSKIDGYDEEKFLNGELELDKDIKSNGVNHEYNLENCILVSKIENIRQSAKTRDNNYLQGENHYLFGKNRTEETKEKISKTRKEKGIAKGKNNPNYGNHKLAGENNPNYGKIGELNVNSKCVIGTNNNGDTIKYKCIKDSKKDGFNPNIIGKCCIQNNIGRENFYKKYKRHRDSHKGYRWFYEEDFIKTVDLYKEEIKN